MPKNGEAQECRTELGGGGARNKSMQQTEIDTRLPSAD